MDGSRIRSRSAAKRRVRGDRGAALVEMAMVVPILALLVFGIIVFGLLLALRQNLAQAAAEGARAGAVAVSGAAQSDAKVAVDQAVDSFGQKCDNGKLTCGTTGVPAAPFDIGPCVNNAAVQCITVKLTLKTDGQVIPSIPLVSIFLPSTISATSVSQVSP